MVQTPHNRLLLKFYNKLFFVNTIGKYGNYNNYNNFNDLVKLDGLLHFYDFDHYHYN